MSDKETRRNDFVLAAISALLRRGQRAQKLPGKKVRLEIDDKIAAVRTQQAGRTMYGLDSVGDGTCGGIEGTDLVLFVRKLTLGGYEVIAVPTAVVQRAFREHWDWRCQTHPQDNVKSPVFLFLDSKDGAPKPKHGPGHDFGREALWRETMTMIRRAPIPTPPAGEASAPEALCREALALIRRIEEESNYRLANESGRWRFVASVE
jgi:hypothetical protein